MADQQTAGEEPKDEEPSDAPLEFYPQGSFRGTIDLGERPEDAEQSIRRAREITVNARTSTDNDFMLAVFTDASAGKESSHTPGGYAVVFENYCPRTHYKGQRIEMAWSMRDMLDNSVGESLAFAQAFQVAAYQLRSIPRHHDDPVKTVVLSIFSDAFEAMQMVKQGNSYPNQSFRWGLFERIVRLVRQLSHEVCGIPGYEVSIEVYWVKGHANVEGNERADKLSNQARIESRNIFITDGKERDANFLPPAVHSQLMDDIDREASRHRPTQEQTAQHGHEPNGRAWNGHERSGRAWINRDRKDRDRHSQQRYPHGRGNNARSFPRFTSNPRGPYSPPPWASESFNPNFDPIRMPRYPRTFPSSSQAGERPHVSENSRPETNELTGFNDLDPGSGPHPGRERVFVSSTQTARASEEEKTRAEKQQPVVHQLATKENLENLEQQENALPIEKSELKVVFEAQASFHGRLDEKSSPLEEYAVPSNATSKDEPRQSIEKPTALGWPVADEQEPLLERFFDEGKAESEPEIQGPVGIPTVVTESAANKQALACDNVANPAEPLREREACEGQILCDHEDVPEREPTPDLGGRTSVRPSASEDDESAMELLLNEQTSFHPQLACECRTQDDLALVDDKDAHGPDETHMHEDAMSEEQIQAAVDRQLEEEAEAALARLMASGVQENVSPGPLPVEVQVQWT
ncbi:hypothetical protein QBC45DRAFT_461053 [Copromyces sp. CBS 386.78]|nr:hypothetical protein QBC45DRAFT_461053 [Copromyces sp. CBS 386.78]